MSREWQPGDVAIVTDGRGRTGRAMKGAVGWDFTPSGSSLNAYSGESEPIEAHPLLVIDPRSMTWDGRIPTAEEFTAWAEAIGAGEFETGILRVADALRDLPAPITPHPKPDEPTGLGAVVRDANNELWIRTCHPCDDCLNKPWQRGPVHRNWFIVDGVEVLSEGYDQGADEPLADWERDLLRGQS